MRLKYLLILLSLVCQLVGAAPATSYVKAGIYSNLYYNVEGGDLLGMELMIVPGKQATYSAFVQISEGGLPDTFLVPLKVNGNRIEFDVTYGGNGSIEHFTGAFKKTELVVRWSGGTEEHLKRRKSYWQAK